MRVIWWDGMITTEDHVMRSHGGPEMDMRPECVLSLTTWSHGRVISFTPSLAAGLRHRASGLLTSSFSPLNGKKPKPWVVFTAAMIKRLGLEWPALWVSTEVLCYLCLTDGAGMAVADITIIVKAVAPPVVTATSVSGELLDILILNILFIATLDEVRMFLVHFVYEDMEPWPS